MNTALWVIQVILCVKLLSVAVTHGFPTHRTTMQRGLQRFGKAARPLLTLIAVAALLVGAGLILPGVSGAQTWLTPWIAGLLVVMMLGSIGFHMACRDTPNVWVGLILCALAAFVCYGRWVMAPL